MRGVRGADDGSTLVEVLIAVLVLGVAGLAILSGLQTELAGARRLQAVASTQVSLDAAAAAIGTVAYRSCATDATPYDALTPGLALPAGTVVTVEELDNAVADAWVPCATPRNAAGAVQRVTVSTADGTRTRTLMRFAAASASAPTVTLSLSSTSTQSSRFVTGYPGSGITITGAASDGSAVIISKGTGWPSAFAMTGTGPATVTWTTSVPSGAVSLPVSLQGTGAWADTREQTSVQVQLWPVLAASSSAAANCSPFRSRSASQPCSLTLSSNQTTGSLGTWTITGTAFDGGSLRTSLVTGTASQLQSLVVNVSPQGSLKQCPSGATRTITISVRDDITGSSVAVPQVITC